MEDINVTFSDELLSRFNEAQRKDLIDELQEMTSKHSTMKVFGLKSNEFMACQNSDGVYVIRKYPKEIQTDTFCTMSPDGEEVLGVHDIKTLSKEEIELATKNLKKMKRVFGNKERGN